MKRHYLTFIVSVLLLGSVHGQPTGDTFPNFTVTDIDGQTHDLQTYLDDGKTVIIDVFATWCSNCINSLPGYEALYEERGQGGDGSYVLLSFESDPNTSNEASFAQQYDVHVPIIADGAPELVDSWNISSQPRYFVICQDGSFTLKPGAGIGNDPQPLIDIADQCGSVLSTAERTVLDFELSVVGNDYLTFSSSEEVLDYEIIDVTGSVVRTGRVLGKVDRIALDGMHNGIYLLAVRSDSAVKTLRFLKN